MTADDAPTHDRPDTTTDPRTLFARAIATATPVVDCVRPDQLDDATPCADMTVRDLLAHLVMVVERVAAAGRGDEPARWPAPPTDVDDTAWPDRWRRAVAAFDPAWADDASLVRTIRLPWTEMSGVEAIATYANEVTVHTWDLATATGQDPSWDGEVVALAWWAIRRQLPADGRAEMWRDARAQLPADYPWQDPFGEAVDVPADAPLIDRLVAYGGRRPTHRGAS